MLDKISEFKNKKYKTEAELSHIFDQEDQNKIME